MIYETYQDAADFDATKPGWFCWEYRGLDPEPYELDAVEDEEVKAVFQKDRKQGGHYKTPAAYVRVIFFNPHDRTKTTEVPMKIDTGADPVYGVTTEIDRLGIEVEEGDEKNNTWASTPGGMIHLKQRDVTIQVGDLQSRPIQIKCPVDANFNTTKWLLGQEFLGLCQHTWTNKTDVKIQLLKREPVPGRPLPAPGITKNTQSDVRLDDVDKSTQSNIRLIQGDKEEMSNRKNVDWADTKPTDLAYSSSAWLSNMAGKSVDETYPGPLPPLPV